MYKEPVWDNDRPLYEQIYEILLNEIRKKNFKDRLPTERELAERFQVSVITVKQAISKLVHDKILYRRPRKGTFISKNAKLPYRKGTDDICFAINSDIKAGLYDPYYYKILETIEKRLNEYSYHIVFSLLEEGTMQDSSMLDRIKQSGFRAFLIAGDVKREFVDFLKSNKLDPILIESNLRDEDLNIITVENETGAYEMTSFLIRQGHKKIAYLGGRTVETSSNERFEGYKKALEDNKITFNPELVVFKGLHIDNGFEGMKELLNRKVDFTAVFCVTDNVALGAMNAIKAAGFEIPDNISVTGFDDIDISSHIVPKLTTMRIDRTRMGNLAVRKL